MKLLAPEFVAKLSNMELKARTIVEGFIVGLHKSPYHGFSVEFSEYRPYIAGDPIKEIDWRAYGRTDKLYIKKHEEETNLRSYIVLDKSASMGFTTTGITKLEYASCLAGALAYLMIKQKDAVGLMLFDRDVVDYLPPSATKVRLFELLARLENLSAGGETSIRLPLDKLSESVRRRSLVIVISDLFDEPEETISSIKRIHFAKSELIVFHILDPAEKTFNYREEAIFEDLETGRRIQTQPWVLRGDYQKKVREFADKIRYELRDAMIDYIPIDTSTPFELSLMAYLYKRSKLL